MPKDPMGRKTCCGKFIYDPDRKCWLNQHGSKIREGKGFYCCDCGKKLRANGKMKKMVESNEPEE